MYVIQRSDIKYISALPDKSLSVYPTDSSRDGRGFAEAGGFVAVGVVPLVETERRDVGTVSAVFKNGEPMITPGPGEVYAAVRDSFFAGEAAVPEQEPFLLLQ